jgi:hypothetical protein
MIGTNTALSLMGRTAARAATTLVRRLAGRAGGITLGSANSTGTFNLSLSCAREKKFRGSHLTL